VGYQKKAIVEIVTKAPPEESWEESETWWLETTKYYGAMNSYIFKGPRWVLTAAFPNSAAAARFTGILDRAEKRASQIWPDGLAPRILS